jgi:hypothetical protein
MHLLVLIVVATVACVVNFVSDLVVFCWEWSGYWSSRWKKNSEVHLGVFFPESNAAWMSSAFPLFSGEKFGRHFWISETVDTDVCPEILPFFPTSSVVNVVFILQTIC